MSYSCPPYHDPLMFHRSRLFYTNKEFKIIHMLPLLSTILAVPSKVEACMSLSRERKGKESYSFLFYEFVLTITFYYKLASLFLGVLYTWVTISTTLVK